MNYLLIAATVCGISLVAASCSKDDDDVQPPVEEPDDNGANSVSDEIAYIRYTWDGLQLVKETVVEKPQGCLNHIDESQDYRTLSGTWYVTGEHDIDDVVLYVEKGKTLNIVLCDGASLTTGNIMVNGKGTTLRIFAQELGTGKLHINDEIDAPSIGPGGQSADSGGVIEIHGGILTQDDSDKNPAIGNYAVMFTHYDLNRIAIYGGTLNVKGDAAGIGGHYYRSVIPTIDIYGGDITAKSLDNDAGIGTGEEYEKDGIISGTIEIHGGKVYAYGGGYGAGIGAGEDATFGVLGISGGYVEAHAGGDCGNWSGGIGAYHSEHSSDTDGCHIGWAGWERIYIGACMRLWTYSPHNGYWENVHYTANWWDFVHQRPWVAIGECNHVDGAYDITNCPYCHSCTLQLK